MRDISLDIIRVTEAAAIAAYGYVGSGKKKLIDKHATEAMRERLNNMPFYGNIIVGEGEKDDSYGLFNGEEVGKLAGKTSEKYDIAVDPVDGTTQTSISGPEAVAVIGMSHDQCMWKPSGFYSEKLAWGPTVEAFRKRFKKNGIGLSNKLEQNVGFAALALKIPVTNLVVCILNRPRHDDIIGKLRDMRVKIKLIQDCDVSGAIATCLKGSNVHLFYGIGGSPEAVITACAIKSLRGGFECRECEKDWSSQKQIRHIEEIVKGPCIFSATGITDGSILKGVKLDSKPITNSVFMRSESGTIRWVTTNHGN